MNWNEIAEGYLCVADEVLTTLKEPILEVADDMTACLRNGGKLLFCGNGGSAADAQHFACEFVNRFLIDRRPFAGLSLTTDMSTISSIANDFSFDEVYEKQVQALGKPGDILFCITTSGNSANVQKACIVAKEIGLLVVGMTGRSGGALAPEVDRLLNISSSTSTPRIQEGHELIMHLLCEKVEEDLVGR